MKKYLAILAIILLSLVAVNQVSAGYNSKAITGNIVGDGQARIGASNIKTINLCSGAAGDFIKVYDTETSVGITISELKFEVGISANNSSQSVTTGNDGVDFQKGIYIDSSVATSLTSVVYDY